MMYFFVMCHLQYDELETSLRDSGVLAQTQKTEHLEVGQRESIKMNKYLKLSDSCCNLQKIFHYSNLARHRNF